MQATIIGIDCATQAKKVGLALATYSHGHTTVAQVTVGAKQKTPVNIVTEWVQQHGGPILLALDAPLGWPALLAPALSRLRAGAELPEKANDLFRRETDRFIKREINQQPLDVGADRIARTAHAALGMLSELRQRLGAPIPLAWSPTIRDVSVIEVYPAATLTAHGIVTTGKDGPAIQQLSDELRKRIELPSDTELIQGNRDALDAVICVLAGHNFLRGEALRPENIALAEQEGWIWVRDSSLAGGL